MVIPVTSVTGPKPHGYLACAMCSSSSPASNTVSQKEFLNRAINFCCNPETWEDWKRRGGDRLAT